MPPGHEERSGPAGADGRLQAGLAAGQGRPGRRSDHEAQPGTEAGATKCLDGPGRVRTGHTMEGRGAAGVRRAWLTGSSRPFFGGSPSAFVWVAPACRLTASTGSTQGGLYKRAEACIE